MNFDTIHTTHGRALAFATGMKLAKPDLNVIVIMGDGDCAAIGGNHFIHAARRNINVTALVINNQIYGMTGGQYSPTTPVNAVATTAPYGDAEPVSTCAEWPRPREPPSSGGGSGQDAGVDKHLHQSAPASGVSPSWRRSRSAPSTSGG